MNNLINIHVQVFYRQRCVFGYIPNTNTVGSQDMEICLTLQETAEELSGVVVQKEL